MRKLAGISFLAVLLVAFTYAPEGDRVRYEGEFDFPPYFAWVTCTGEWIVEGTQSWKGHYDGHMTPSGNYRFNWHETYKMDLVGETGRKYVGGGVYNETFHVAPGQEFFVRQRSRLNAQGNTDQDDYFATYVWRFKVLPDGTVQKDFVEGSVECK
jgi:hypothetical protein